MVSLTLQEHMLEDIINANIVQLNGSTLSAQIQTNQESMIFSVLIPSNDAKQEIAEFTLNYDDIQSVEHSGLGHWVINRCEGEQLSLQCFAFRESGRVFIPGGAI